MSAVTMLPEKLPPIPLPPVTTNGTLLAQLPREVVITRYPVTAPAGTTAWRVVVPFPPVIARGSPARVTAAPDRLEPLIATVVPAAPLDGDIDVQ